MGLARWDPLRALQNLENEMNPHFPARLPQASGSDPNDYNMIEFQPDQRGFNQISPQADQAQ